MRFLRALVLWVLLESCVCINDEGRALLKFRERVDLDAFGALLDWDGDAADACLWFGVECSDGKIVSLNLKDLRLEGTLSPELGKLIHIKSLILLNNSFSGIIPKEIGELHKLEVLDLRHNNFSGPLPSGLNDMVSLGILVLRGNRFGDSISPELNDISALSELGTGEELISSHKGCKTRNVGNMPTRKLLQVGGEDQVWHHKNQINIFKSHSMPAPALSPSPFAFDLAPSGSPSLSPFPSRAFSPSSPSSAPFLSPSPSIEFPSPIPSSSPIIKPSSPAVKPELHTEPPPNFVLSPEVSNQGKSTKAWIIYVPIIVGVSFLLALSALYMLCCRANNVVTVRPWATGLSGQLQKAFVTGVPALKRSELETACEDFSNIIGSLSDCRLYKGTLSSGVEIAVVSTAITSAKDWSKHSESQFRKKISELSKVNHKNFVNLLGYCAEQEPFTRMLVFEYAPNGTLFEHLHIKEAEDLDWAARMRIAMGIAYCLEHMQQLNPPVILKTLDTSAIYLTDDFASKVGDISFWNNASETLLQSESIVYKFGMLMLEIISGRVPFSEENGNPEPWLSCYLKGTISEKEIIDPALGSFRDEDIKALLEVISSCIRPEMEDRPKMAEVASSLKHITSMTPDRATPSVSPLWWAEIEILSSEAN